METTPGYKHLPYVPQEMTRLSRLRGLAKLQITRPQTHQSDVLSALQDRRIFRFAGHGLTDQEDPSKSSLILSDGLLAVASLLERNVHNRAPFLAYISACETGEVKQGNLIDEALHLISACQLAGFQYVIGMLWIVKDERIRKFGESAPQSDKSAAPSSAARLAAVRGAIWPRPRVRRLRCHLFSLATRVISALRPGCVAATLRPLRYFSVPIPAALLGVLAIGTKGASWVRTLARLELLLRRLVKRTARSCLLLSWDFVDRRVVCSLPFPVLWHAPWMTIVGIELWEY